MSVALGAGKCKKNNSYDDDKQYVYNWYEVFQKIGRLLSKEKYAEHVDKVKSLEREVQCSHQRIDEAANEIHRIKNPDAPIGEGYPNRRI